MTLFQLAFYAMTIRYFKAVTKRETRLVYGLPGPFLVVASFVSVFVKGPPALSIVLFVAGSSSMQQDRQP